MVYNGPSCARGSSKVCKDFRPRALLKDPEVVNAAKSTDIKAADSPIVKEVALKIQTQSENKK